MGVGIGTGQGWWTVGGVAAIATGATIIITTNKSHVDEAQKNAKAEEKENVAAAIRTYGGFQQAQQAGVLPLKEDPTNKEYLHSIGFTDAEIMRLANEVKNQGKVCPGK